MMVTHRSGTEAWFAAWGTTNPVGRNDSGMEPDFGFLSDVPKQIRIPIVNRDFCLGSAGGDTMEDSFCAGYQ